MTSASEQPQSRREVLQRGLMAITARLPPGWSGQFGHHVQSEGPVTIHITSPRGEDASFIAEARMGVAGRDVEQVRAKLLGVEGRSAPLSTPIHPMLVAPYLSKPVRGRLEKAGLSYVDLTGNIRIELSEPGLFLRDRGSDADPWRTPGRPRGTLKGEPAARVVRTLADFNRVWTMRELIAASGTSTGAAYRVIAYLEREGHVVRDRERKVHLLDWVNLLRAWSADYSIIGSNRTTRWIAPRGIRHLLEQIAQSGAQQEQADQAFRHAVTGTLAAAEWAPYAPASMVMAYVTNTEAAANAWRLHPADAGANVLLIEPAYDTMLERTTTNDAGLRLVAPTQAAVDLLTGPGRNPSEAEKLLEQLQQHEEAWRQHG